MPGPSSPLVHLFSNPVLPVLLLALAILAINPIGYKGGGYDDWQYLKAARCAAEHGFCVPQDHWWRRFMLVLPSALAIRALGESALTLMIVPLAYGLGSIILFVQLLQRQFGKRAALLGGLAFAATPVIGERLLEMNIDTAELVFLLGSVTCLQLGHRRGGPWLFAAAGVLFGTAILARPTQLALLPIFAAAFWLVPVWRCRALAFAGGVVTPILAEAAVYAVWVGDALFPWRLSAAHTRIPSTELEKSVDLTQSPLFNIDYIDGWIPSMGISVHWTVDGLINLLAHPAIGLTFAAAIMLLGLGHRWLRSPDPHARLFLFLIGASALFFGALVYGFAIDPKPRMFLPVLAVAAAAFGVLAAERMRRRDMLLVTVCLCLMAGKAVISSWDRLKVDSTAAIAANWARDEPGAIALAPLTSALLTLTPELRDLPVGKDARPKLMLLGGGTCARSIQEEFAGWQVLREHRYGLEENALVSRLREARIFFQPRQVIVLCLITKPA